MAHYIDMHCDTLLHAYAHGYKTIYESDQTMLDVKRLKEAEAYAQCFAVFFPPKPRPDAPARKPKPGGFSVPKIEDDIEFFKQAREILLNTIKEYPQDVALAGSLLELEKNAAENKVSAILTLEDGRAVEGKSERLDWFYEQGVRMIALTWNHANCFGYPNSTDPEIMNRGLTDFGIEAIAQMNRLGILIDVSHLSDGGFADVARYSKKPFVASHSNCREVTPHPRNLTDDMIRILAEHGGVAGLNFCPAFVEEESGSGITSAKRLAVHARHLLNKGGEDIVAIGTDFDGMDGKLEIRQPKEMELLFEAMKEQGFTQRQIDKAANENFKRVFGSI